MLSVIYEKIDENIDFFGENAFIMVRGIYFAKCYDGGGGSMTNREDKINRSRGKNKQNGGNGNNKTKKGTPPPIKKEKKSLSSFWEWQISSDSIESLLAMASDVY